jgi:hypothetical protein
MMGDGSAALGHGKYVSVPRRWISIAGIAIWLALSLYFLVPRLVSWSVLPDFTVYWATAHVPNPYDTEALTAAQSFAVDPKFGPRPFAYPPPALLLVLPFSLLPFWPAYWLWLAISAVAFWTAARQVVPRSAALLALAAPHTVLVFILGQSTLIVGALVIWGLALVREKPMAGGVLLGLATAIKPQMAFMAPLAFLSGRHWTALGGYCLGLGTAVVISLPFGLWDDWLSVFNSFDPIEAYGATPAMAAKTLRLPVLPVQIVGAVAGIWVIWTGFKREDIDARLLAFVTASLLVSPYGIRYDLAVLSPVFAAALLSGRILVAAPAFMLHSISIVPSLFVSLLANQVLDRAPGRHGSRGDEGELRLPRRPT